MNKKILKVSVFIFIPFIFSGFKNVNQYDYSDNKSIISEKIYKYISFNQWQNQWLNSKTRRQRLY